MLPFEAGGPPLPPEQLKAILGSAVMRHVSLGWRIVTQYPGQTVMRRSNEVNHLAHSLATVFTCGLWLPVYVVLAVTSEEQRIALAVDPYGVVLINGLPAPPPSLMPGPAVPSPRPVGVPLPGDGNARAVAAANARRALRQKAREQAAEDLLLARELRIGRPDLPRHYDDGGLVDLNHVPAHALTTLRGVTPEIADQIVAVRDRVGAFSSAEELAATAGLHPDLTPEIREYGIFLP